jgi:hypothetical protein
MRGNGLTAADYAPAAVLDVALTADALLALREAGVAAYAVEARVEPDRQVTLFVDRVALTRARDVLRRVSVESAGTEPPAEVDENAWNEIVRGYSDTAPDPDRHDEPPPAPTRDDAATTPPPRRPHPLVGDEDHFVPAPLPPAPRVDRVDRLAWSGVLGSPLFLLAAALVSWAPPRVLLLLCALAFVGGIVTLVVRMKDRAPTDDGPDDGAVV